MHIILLNSTILRSRFLDSVYKDDDCHTYKLSLILIFIKYNWLWIDILNSPRIWEGINQLFNIFLSYFFLFLSCIPHKLFPKFLFSNSLILKLSKNSNYILFFLISSTRFLVSFLHSFIGVFSPWFHKFTPLTHALWYHWF